MFWRLLVLLLLVNMLASGQYAFEHFNSEVVWRSIQIDKGKAAPNIHPGDTCFIMASVRVSAEGELRFMTEEAQNDSLIYLFVYFRNGHWRLRQTPGLQEAVELLPDRNKDWVVFAEGMGKVFPSNIDRAMRLATQYGVNVLMFDYPSIRSDLKAYKNYRFAWRQSKSVHSRYLDLMDTISRLRQLHKMGTGALSLFFHSMGNNIIRELSLAGKLDPLNNVVWVDNLILNAPCVPRRQHRKWIDRIKFANRIYLHYNPQDEALKWARLAGFRNILGERIKGPVSEQLICINFNTLTGSGHSNFLDFSPRHPINTAAIRHYSSLFHGDSVLLSDGSYYKPTDYRGVGWDIIAID